MHLGGCNNTNTMRYSRIDSFFGLLKYFNAVLLVGLLVILWAGKTRPVEVTAECEHYRARFGIAPTYKFGLTEFHCEFREEDLPERLKKRHAAPAI